MGEKTSKNSFSYLDYSTKNEETSQEIPTRKQKTDKSADQPVETQDYRILEPQEDPKSEAANLNSAKIILFSPAPSPTIAHSFPIVFWPSGTVIANCNFIIFW